MHGPDPRRRLILTLTLTLTLTVTITTHHSQLILNMQHSPLTLASPLTLTMHSEKQLNETCSS